MASPSYPQGEVKAEALVRNVGSYSRFLQIASLVAGQQVNVSNLARESAICRDTARRYLSVLEDTLLVSWLPAYRPRAKMKEVVAPKPCWFNAGVLHVACTDFRQPLPSNFKGIPLEHWIYHELKTFLHVRKAEGTQRTFSCLSISVQDLVLGLIDH
jgi:uncharacterized protein